MTKLSKVLLLAVLISVLFPTAAFAQREAGFVALPQRWQRGSLNGVTLDVPHHTIQGETRFILTTFGLGDDRVGIVAQDADGCFVDSFNRLMRLWMPLPTYVSLDNARICRWDESELRWVSLDSVWRLGRLVARTIELGVFAVMDCSDMNAPLPYTPPR